MIYSTACIPSYELAGEPEDRAAKIEAELTALARERSVVLREQARSNPAHLGPKPAERSYGDIIIVMVDPGEGSNINNELLHTLQRGETGRVEGPVH